MRVDMAECMPLVARIAGMPPPPRPKDGLASAESVSGGMMTAITAALTRRFRYMGFASDCLGLFAFGGTCIPTHPTITRVLTPFFSEQGTPAGSETKLKNTD